MSHAGLIRLRVSRAAARAILAIVLALACVLALDAPAARAAEPRFPALSGRVVDEAGVLSPAARAALAQKLKEHEDKTSDQIVVATVRSLEGHAVEDYANRLFRAWKLGQDKTNNGVLVLVAPNERKVRIEVGYGLEGTLTDAISKVIIATVVAPKFKTGDFDGGVAAATDAVLAALTGDDEWKQRAKVRRSEESSAVPPLLLFALAFIVIFVVLPRLAGRANPSAARNHRTRNGRWIALPAPSPGWGGGWGGGGSFGGGFSGGFSGGGGSSGGGGASGDW